MMKKAIISILAIATILTGCKKDDTVRPSGSYEINGTPTATAADLPNNLFEGESISVSMPKSAILGILRMTEDEFTKAWANGEIKFGACENNSHSAITWGSTSGQGKWGHCFGENGKVYSAGESGAVISIEGTTSPFNYKITGVGSYYDYTGKVIECQQVFQYTDDLKTGTAFVPWKVTIKKGDPRVLKTKKDFVSHTYDKGKQSMFTTVSMSDIQEVIGVNPETSPAYAYVDDKITGTKGTELYFDVNGKAVAQKDAALVFFREDGVWYVRFTDNELAEGNTVEFKVAFVNEVTNYCYIYHIGALATERTFAEFQGTFSMSTGIVFQGSMLSTGRQREYTFDLPEATYIALEEIAKQKGQSGVTLAQLVLGGYVTVLGPMATKEESTFSPYGHWFDSSTKVCKEGAENAYACFAITPRMADGHCLVTLKNVPGANKAGDRKMFQQTFHSTVLGLDIPVTYIISVKE